MLQTSFSILLSPYAIINQALLLLPQPELRNILSSFTRQTLSKMQPIYSLIYRVLVLVVLVASETNIKPCYTPMGESRNKQFNVSNGFFYAPCDNIKEHSMCCAIGYGKDISKADSCRPDGLCYNQGADVYWRESCTDPTWEHPSCIKLFVNGTGFNGEEPIYHGKLNFFLEFWILFIDPRQGGIPVTDVRVTPCLDGRYCSGDGASSTECCETGQGLFISNGQQLTENPNKTETSMGLQPSQTVIDSIDGEGLTSGAGLGIGVATGIGVSLIATGLACFWMRRKKYSLITGHNSLASEAPGEQIHRATVQKLKLASCGSATEILNPRTELPTYGSSRVELDS